VVVSNVAGSTTSSVATLTVTSPANCAPTPSGLVGWWTGDGSAADFLGFDPGSLHGSATATAAGVVGQAFSFDGTNAFVQIPDSAPLRPANLTIETWVMFTALDTPSLGGSPAGDQYVIFKQNTQSGNFEGFDLGKTRVPGGDVFKLLISSALGESAEIHSATHISTNVWYHVAGVRGANFTQIYVNGVLENQTNIDFPQDYGTLPLYFGTSGQSYWDHKLAGMLDEVSLYNRALSSAEIASIYAAGAGGKCKVPVGPTIVTQPTRQLLVLNGTVNFSAMAVGSATIGYRWSKDGVYLANGGRISGATSSVLTLTNLQAADAGNYQVTVTNSAGTAVSQVALLSTELPPANDAFASAQAISGGSGFVTGSSANATKESGEPYHAGNAGGASVWYNWTAPSTSPVTFDTALTSFDTLLAVYTGSAVNALTLVASNDNISTNNSRSRLTFTPVAGTVYHIAVDGANGANGNLTLRWAQATTPLPDLSIVGSAVNPYISTETFSPSSCAVMEGLIQAGTRRLIRFDTETENSGTTSLYFGDPSTNSLFVWAPCHAHFHFQNYMSYRLRNSSGALVAVGLKVGFCILDVFRWDPNSASSALYTCNNQGIQRGWGDLYDHTLDGQWIDTTGLPDGNYTMELEANPLGIIQEANYGNNLTTVPISIGNPTAPPLNDNFASAQTLLGGFASTVGFTPNATKQAGEPNHAGNAGGHSVWYQWTAVSTKSVTIDTLSSSFNTLLAVYTGSSLSGLTVVASNDDIGPGVLQSRVTFPATAGTVYNIAVDGYNGASGNLVLTLNQTIQNDNFANAEFIGGVSGLVHGSTSGATKEAGEPNHAGNAGGHSIWYAWTAPVDGIATFDTIGSSFNTLLAAYTGGSLATLVPVASNDDISASNTLSRITFSAIGLSRYYLAIDGYNGDSGDSTMNWSLTATGVAAPPYLANQPSVLTYKFLSDGEFQLTVNGKPQQQYLIQRSDDLANWSTLAPTLADPNGHAYFIDKGGPHGILRSGIIDPICGPDGQTGIATAPRSTRFYRAIALNPN
jgi:hypothetical protein